MRFVPQSLLISYSKTSSSYSFSHHVCKHHWIPGYLTQYHLSLTMYTKPLFAQLRRNPLRSHIRRQCFLSHDLRNFSRHATHFLFLLPHVQLHIRHELRSNSRDHWVRRPTWDAQQSLSLESISRVSLSLNPPLDSRIRN